MTRRDFALAFLTLCVITPPTARPARAQPVTGLYIAAGAGGNFMESESFTRSVRIGASAFTFGSSVSPFGAYFGPPTTTRTPAYGVSFHSPIKLDPGGAGVLSAGYGLGNGLRLELEADYRVNAFSDARGSEQKFGGMLNAVYDLPSISFGITPYAGLGAGYMWVDRDHTFARTDGFAYQAILGGSLPVPGVPGLSATLEYRFMGLVGADHRFSVPGFAFSGFNFSSVQDPSVGKDKFSDDFNHSVMVGLRYAFNAAATPVADVVRPPLIIDYASTYLVFFDWDRADLTDRTRQIIAEAARQTTRIQVTRIQVNGNTDTSGTARYNQALSVRRAQNVAAELVRDGVPRAAISTQGLGFSNPLVATGPGVRELQNRRVEIILR